MVGVCAPVYIRQMCEQQRAYVFACLQLPVCLYPGDAITKYTSECHSSLHANGGTTVVTRRTTRQIGREPANTTMHVLYEDRCRHSPRACWRPERWPAASISDEMGQAKQQSQCQHLTVENWGVGSQQAETGSASLSVMTVTKRC